MWGNVCVSVGTGYYFGIQTYVLHIVGLFGNEYICISCLPAHFCFECFHVSVATGYISGQKLMFSINRSSLEGE